VDAERTVHSPKLLIMENRLLKTAHLLPGEPLGEVSQLAMVYDSEVDAYCLQLLSVPDESPVAEYWFGNLEQAERQAVIVFGERFAGWSEGDGLRLGGEAVQ